MTRRDASVPVAVLGATGLVGQHLVRLLDDHPWFRVTEVVASPDKAGRRYGDAVAWALGATVPPSVGALRLGDPGCRPRARLVLSALPSDAASRVERRLVSEGHVVCSNASAHRMDRDVPLVIPEVNAGALPSPDGAGGGVLIANANCVVAGLVPVLAVLEARWGVEGGTVVTLQALSGAGLNGPSGLRSLGNVVPFIPGEEEKIGEELSKILGRRVPWAVAVNRVPVADGHMAHVFLRLQTRATPEEVSQALADFAPDARVGALPSVPERPIRVCADPFRPQPALDIAWAGGMGVTVGRVRRVPDHDVALVLVVHNAVRGAAGACLANAELACAKGWVNRGPPTP